MTQHKHRRIRVTRLLPVLDFGGVESRVVLQSRMIDPEEFDFRVCTFWRPGEAAKRIGGAGVPVDVLDVDPTVKNPKATTALVSYLRHTSPDILHASIAEANFHGALAGAMAQIPHRIVEEVGIPARGRLGRTVFRGLYGLAHRVVGVSEATCDVLRREGAPEEKLQLVYNCADPAFFEAAGEERPSAPPVEFLAVGRLVPVKNHANLLRAFRRVVDEVSDVRLRIAGEGRLRDELAALIETLGLEEYVELLGFRRDVRRLLQSSHVFVLPSWTEGCSISLVEAMSTGIVPLGSTAGGITEVMGDLEGLQVPPDDIEGWTESLLRCATMSPTMRRRVGSRARDIARRRFSPWVYNRNVSRMYREMAASTDRRD